MTAIELRMQWLKNRSRGFRALSDDEVFAIVNFTFLWTLFEARVLDHAASATRIAERVAEWDAAGSLNPASYGPELAYFRSRYFAAGAFSAHFDGLNLRTNDNSQLVRDVLAATRHEPRDTVTALLIISLRFRNNLFHGLKWEYDLEGQLANFTNANAVLERVLERHGNL